MCWKVSLEATVLKVGYPKSYILAAKIPDKKCVGLPPRFFTQVLSCPSISYSEMM